MTGLITTIQRMSIHDGPGIRSSIFLKGCNLRCAWCHNPETWSISPQLQYIKDRCAACHKCTQTCPQRAVSISEATELLIDRNKCNCCALCVDTCYSGALSIAGESVTAAQVMQRISQDIPFFKQSHGGVTISGGEPLMQPRFTEALLRQCRERGIHTAVETNMSGAWSEIERLLPLVDLWMCDMKIADEQQHREWTGSGNRTIIENIRLLGRRGAQVIIRTPVVPGVNDTAPQIEAICNIVKDIEGLHSYELLAFHPLGFNKFEHLGMQNPMHDAEFLSAQKMEELNAVVKRMNLKTT